MTEEICPSCGKKFQCFSKGVFEGARGMLQVTLMTTYFPTIDHFTVSCLVAWPLNESEAGGDLVLIETSLLFSC